jgi:RNA polymerase sigma-70 factor (ECF subfamily)
VVVETSSQRFETALRAGAYAAAWRYCCRLCSSYEAAQDLLQDSLAHALQRFDTLREQDSFRAWLLAVVRTQFLSALRRQRLSLPLSGEELERLSTPAPEDELVLAGLRLLPAAQRELLALFYIEGLSLAELGRVLGLPTVAVRHRLHRAREALRRKVRQESSSVSTTTAAGELKP